MTTDIPSPRLDPQTVGNCGLFFVCHKLSRMGWNVMPTSRNARAIDVVAYWGTGDRFAGIQVKSLTRTRDPVPLGRSLDRIAGDYWIVVTAATGPAPECFVLLPEEVRSLAFRDRGANAAYWLQPKSYAVDAFRERWDRIVAG